MAATVIKLGWMGSYLGTYYVCLYVVVSDDGVLFLSTLHYAVEPGVATKKGRNDHRSLWLR